MYAFADDLACLCTNIREAKTVIRRIEKWGRSYKMTLKKEKSGIMFINSKNQKLTKWESQTRSILKIPIINSYEYLGISINKNLKPI